MSLCPDKIEHDSVLLEVSFQALGLKALEQYKVIADIKLTGFIIIVMCIQTK